MADRRERRTVRRRVQVGLRVASTLPVSGALLLWLSLQSQIPYEDLLLDPASLGGLPWYTGLVSNLGVLGWTTATATGAFGAWVARYGGRPGAAAMLTRGSLLSGLLLFDDLFQLHVVVHPLFGITKPMVYALYLAVALWWIVGQRHEVLRTNYEILLTAVALLGLSVIVDQAADRLTGLITLAPDVRLLLEDAPKFVGVLVWAQYFVVTSWAITRSIISELRSRAEATTRAEETRGTSTSEGPEVAAGAASATMPG
jgi:hypothetical protein